MEETWAEKLVNAAVFFCIVSGILFVGWNEPLSYRFLTEREISNREQPETADASSPSDWRTQFGGTALDRAPYKVKKGKVVYSRNFDPNEAGTPTETDQRQGLRR